MCKNKDLNNMGIQHLKIAENYYDKTAEKNRKTQLVTDLLPLLIIKRISINDTFNFNCFVDFFRDQYVGFNGAEK